MPSDISWTDMLVRPAVDMRLATPPSVFLEPVPASGAVKLSVIVPAFNEERTLARAITSLLDVDLACDFEVIVVNDGSTDETEAILEEMSHPFLRVVHHGINQGKGAAVMTALSLATGTHVLVFDADLEYSPDDIPALIAPVLDGTATVVFGARPLRQSGSHQGLQYLLGNLVTSGLARLLYRSRIQDMHTCFKLLPVSLLSRMPLCEPGFGLDTQLTVGVLSSGHRLHEVPISYRPRSRDEGKKINWRDGVRCIVLLVKYRFTEAVRPVNDLQEHVDREARDATFLELRQESAVA